MREQNSTDVFVVYNMIYRYQFKGVLGNITNKGARGDNINRAPGGKSVTWSEVARGQMAGEGV